MKLRESPSTRLAENVLGRTLTPVPAAPAWKHPWFTELLWQPSSKAWAGFVQPGWVNGQSPTVRTTVDAVREGRGTYFGQLVDARSGADEIEQLARLAIGEEFDGLPGDTRIDVPLYKRPPVLLRDWRPIGWDGGGGVPEFFQDRGVGNPPPDIAEQLQSQRINVATITQPAGNRLLRACDIMVLQPRTALTSEIEVDPSGFVSGTGLVNQTLSFRLPGAGERLRIVSGTFNPQQNLNMNFASRNLNLLASDYEEKTWDEVLIATAYVLSPPDTDPSAEPDATWQGFVRHTAYWNLSWAQPRLQPVFNTDIFRPLVALTGILAGGVGIGAVSWLASSINDATQSAFNILQAQSLAGAFWTATGGGVMGHVPPPPPDAEPSTLDKAATVAARKREADAARRARRLDPEFPHDGIKFNSALLS